MTRTIERQSAVIRAPHDGSEVGVCELRTPDDVRAAIEANVREAERVRRMPAHERAAALRRIADGLEAVLPEMARTLALEAGKSITQARLELGRAVFVFRDAAEEATRIEGELLPGDVVPAGDRRFALVKRFPLAPIAAITPFNYPVLLAAHKIGPAIACGATITLKPPPQDPLTTLRLAEIIAAAGWPEGAVHVVPCTVETAQVLIEDPRVRMISFTGSARAGWAIRAKAGSKRVALELGGNAAAIVEADADLEWAVTRLLPGGFAYSGQSCISTQRVFVHERVYRPFLDAFVPKVQALKMGDVLDEKTDVGPLISLDAAERVERWIAEAKAAGATVLTGGGRKGAYVEATVLTDTSPDMKVNCEEIFGPVVTITPYRDIAQAIAWTNASPFGLQAGVFTTSLKTMFHAFDALDVGAVNGNDIPGFRLDRLPYGGAKHSGLGREGVRYAIQEMTESRMLTLRTE